MNEPILTPISISGARARRETINFGGQEVRGQSQVRPKLDLETRMAEASFLTREFFLV